MQSKTPAKTQEFSKEIPDQVGNDKKGDPGTVSGMTKAISSVTGSFTLRVQDDAQGWRPRNKSGVTK